MTWMHAGKTQGFDYSALNHNLAKEQGINTAYIQNQNILFTHQAMLMLASLNNYDQQQVLREIHFVNNNPNAACEVKSGANLLKRLYRTKYPFKNYHYLIEYKVNGQNKVVISDIYFDRALFGTKSKPSGERTMMYNVSQLGSSQYDGPKDQKQFDKLQGEWELGLPTSQIQTEHASVNGMLNNAQKAAWLMGVHTQVAYKEDNVTKYTLFHNPSDKGLLDLVECAFDKRSGKKSHNAQHLAAVLHQRQSQGKPTKWLVHSQGAIIFCAALEHYKSHYTGMLTHQELKIHGSGSNLVRLESAAKSLGVKTHKANNNPFDLVPNIAGTNDLSLSSLKRSFQFLGLVKGDDSPASPLVSPHTLPYLGIESYKAQLQIMGYDKHASKVQKYINKSVIS